MAEILFHCAGDHERRMHDALAAALPDHQLRVWPDVGDRGAIHYAIAWQPPATFFDDLVSLQAVFALAAGVDQLLRHPGLPASVPIVRLDDAGMARKMSEYVLYGVLHAHRQMPRLLEAMRQGRWDDAVRTPPAARVDVGILGAGTLGTAVAQRLVANGYPVACWGMRARSLPEGIAHRSGADGLRSMLATSRVLVCLLPLTDATHGILNAALFAGLPDGAFLINAARGEHLVETDLLRAIESGKLAGALLDVFAEEPLPATHPFRSQPRVLITPHLAAPSGARDSAAQVATSLAAMAAGEHPPGLVDRDRGY